MGWEYTSPPELTTREARLEHYHRTRALRQQTLDDLGWQRLSDSDDSLFEARLRARFPILDGSRPPEPHVIWDVSAIYDDRKSYEALETDLNLNALHSLRECSMPGEQIFAIDWQHKWYSFQPHTFPSTGDPYNWAVPVLPDGDTYLFLPLDCRFGIVGIPHSTICIYGRELLEAFGRNQPLLFSKQIAWPPDPGPKDESPLSGSA